MLQNGLNKFWAVVYKMTELSEFQLLRSILFHWLNTWDLFKKQNVFEVKRWCTIHVYVLIPR